MKKIIAIVLVALMAVPFAVLSSAATVPAEPTLTTDSVFYYCTSGTHKNGHTSSNDNTGLSTDQAKVSFGTGTDTGLMALCKAAGGKVVVPGKAYVAKTYTLPKCGGTVMFTALDTNGTDYSAGSVAQKDDGANGDQCGMFMGNGDIAFEGDYILDDIVILRRTDKGTKLVVKNGANLVIGDGVTFQQMLVKDENDAFTVVQETAPITVEEGGNLFLHTAGFSSYSGKGTIVVDQALVTAGKVTKATFAGFEGTVMNETGADPFATTGGDTTETPDNPSTGDVTVAFAFLAAFSAISAGAVLTLKKRAN